MSIDKEIRTDVAYFKHLYLSITVPQIPRQHLGQHEVIHIFVSPIREVAGDARN